MAVAKDEESDALQTPLLTPLSAASTDGDVGRGSAKKAELSLSAVWQEMLQQGRLGAPLALNLVLQYCLPVISLSFVGRFGTTALAAAGMSSSAGWMVGRLILMGLSSALDTQASQAFGAGDLQSLGMLYQRCVLFLLVHCIPLTATLMCVPRILGAMGESAELQRMVSHYVLGMLPGLWIEAFNRPLNRILVAQRITLPQLWAVLMLVPLHIASNIFWVYKANFGFLGAAFANSTASALNVLLVSGFVWAMGIQDRVFGRPTWRALQGWGQLARLAYPACLMRCIESWSISGMSLAAGLLPDAERSLASVSLCFSTWGIFYMLFNASGMAVCTRVGNALGAGRGDRARVALIAGAAIAPLLGCAVCALLLLPATQRGIIRLLTHGSDPLLEAQLMRLLRIVAAVIFFDGFQSLMVGVVQAAAKQAKGALINFVSYYCCGVPLALWLAFGAGWGVTGLLAGLVAGPATQSVAYCLIMFRIDWDEEAARAARRRSCGATPLISIDARCDAEQPAPLLGVPCEPNLDLVSDESLTAESKQREGLTEEVQDLEEPLCPTCVTLA